MTCSTSDIDFGNSITNAKNKFNKITHGLPEFYQWMYFTWGIKIERRAIEQNYYGFVKYEWHVIEITDLELATLFKLKYS